jgi:hypothetical protein
MPAATIYTVWSERNARLFKKNYRATLSITSKIFYWVRTKVNSKQCGRDSLMNKDLVRSWGFFNKALLIQKTKNSETQAV